MKHVLVLTRQPESYAARRFAEASAGFPDARVSLVDPHEFRLSLVRGKPTSILGPAGEGLEGSVVIPRISSLGTEFSLSALEHLELAGIRSVNPYGGMLAVRHKFSALCALAGAGVPVPDSVMLRAPADVNEAAEALGGYPVVLKFIRGSQGVGVVLANDANVAQSVLEALNLIQYDVMIQRFHPEAARGDTRVLVLGGEARWAVRRESSGEGFRSNFHRGGRYSVAQPDSATAGLAEKAAGVFGLGLAGVDIVDGPSGPMVLEVNGSPGFETVEGAYRVDVAAEIISYALTVG